MLVLGATVDDPKIKTSPCKRVNAGSVPAAIRKNFKLVKAADEARSPGYNKSCDCYYWGYRPEIIAILGLGGVHYDDRSWSICLDPQTNCPLVKECPTCPPKTTCPPPKACPKPKDCPACPKQTPCPACKAAPCPSCPECPQLQTPTTLPEDDRGKFGPVLGFLLAATVVGGAGFYAYKKLRKGKR